MGGESCTVLRLRLMRKLAMFLMVCGYMGLYLLSTTHQAAFYMNFKKFHKLLVNTDKCISWSVMIFTLFNGSYNAYFAVFFQVAAFLSNLLLF